jgi:hypothetical protein|tara:strand:- start:83 stop:268 length:186 start_codon:yes stop_codon:yes gene_type:complete
MRLAIAWTFENNEQISENILLLKYHYFNEFLEKIEQNRGLKKAQNGLAKKHLNGLKLTSFN